MMYKLLIIDDEPLVQAGLRSMLTWEDLDIEICGVAGNGKIGLEIIEKEHPDIVITDIKMPVMSGLELLKLTRERYGNVHPAFIILTSYEDFHMAKEAISYTIVDYLVKIELTPDTLKGAVEKALTLLTEKKTKEKTSPEMTQADIQSLRDKFFIRLLHNLFDSEEQFALLHKELSIPFTYQAYQCCYFEMINEKADALPLEQQVILYANSFHLLQEITIKYQQAYFVTLDRKHGVILFLYEKEDCLKPDTSVSQITEQLKETLLGYYGTQLRWGIGNKVTYALAVSDSYRNARQDFNMSFTGSKNQRAHAIFNISIFKDDLCKAFSEYDAELLQQVLAQIISLFEEHPQHYLQALDAACNILFLGLNLIPDGEAVLSSVFEDMSDGYRSIYRQTTTVQVTSWLTTFTRRLSRIFTEHKKEHRHHVVESVKKYIESHLQDKLNLNEVSAIFGISPNYLSTLFKKYNDCGYSEYITYRKIEEAKKMMSEGNQKIYEIASALGFESAFYFSKVFKKVEGISPTDYLNK